MKPRFGDLVRNIAAGERNPRRDAIFVREVRRRGHMNPGLWYECTDGDGRFWQTTPRSIVVTKRRVEAELEALESNEATEVDVERDPT